MRFLCLCFLACFTALTTFAQSVKRIRLNMPKTRPAASPFRVVSVIDDREDTATIGTMRAGLANRERLVSLEGGVAGSVAGLLEKYQNPSAGAAPVTVHIRQLRVSETATLMKQRLTIAYNYAIVGEYGELSYDGSAFAESTQDVSAYIERLVRESVISTFDKAAGAWKSNGQGGAPSIRIDVRIEPQPAAMGLISYDPARPLRYDDFKGPVDDLSRGSAATYTGISFAYSAQQTGADFRIIVTLSAITDPEKSWMRPGARQPRVLAHENLHFAITAAMACRLADTLRTLVVTKDGYDAALRQAFNAIDRQLEQQQRLYDGETAHGTVPQQQAAWETRVYDELARAACYKK